MQYANITDGASDMTYEQMCDEWRRNPYSDDMDDAYWVADDGTEYTPRDLAEITGVPCEDRSDW